MLLPSSKLAPKLQLPAQGLNNVTTNHCSLSEQLAFVSADLLCSKEFACLMSSSVLIDHRGKWPS